LTGKTLHIKAEKESRNPPHGVRKPIRMRNSKNEGKFRAVKEITKKVQKKGIWAKVSRGQREFIKTETGGMRKVNRMKGKLKKKVFL